MCFPSVWQEGMGSNPAWVTCSNPAQLAKYTICHTHIYMYIRRCRVLFRLGLFPSWPRYVHSIYIVNDDFMRVLRWTCAPVLVVLPTCTCVHVTPIVPQSHENGVSWPSGLAYRTQVLVLAAECGFESRPWHLCPWARHLIIIASLHPGVKWVPVRAELVD